MSKICAWCGKEFEPPSKRSDYCTDECARQARLKRQRDYQKQRRGTPATKVCVICGKEFEIKHGNSKTCSEGCATEHKRRVMRELYEKGKKARKPKKHQEPRIRICVICGKEFTVRGNSICCSDKCRAENGRKLSREYYWAHKKTTMRTCVICGTEFVAKGAMKVCGMEECRVKRDRQRQKDYWESYSAIAKQKRKEYEAELKAKQQPLFDGKVLDRAEMTVDEYNKTHGTNYSYGQYVFYVERDLI